MRLYTFVNYYLSSLQQGLQTAHVVSELFVHYPNDALLNDWAQNHKTIVILNGGNSQSIWEICMRLATHNLPRGIFEEDAQSLNCAVTACGVIVPAHIYEFSAIRVFDESNQYLLESVSEDDQAIANILKSCPLAR